MRAGCTGLIPLTSHLVAFCRILCHFIFQLYFFLGLRAVFLGYRFLLFFR